jgi:hypothetical protein
VEGFNSGVKVLTNPTAIVVTIAKCAKLIVKFSLVVIVVVWNFIVKPVQQPSALRKFVHEAFLTAYTFCHLLNAAVAIPLSF